MTEQSLLSADALAGLRIAISASESSDLARLGLVEDHFRLALGEIARSVLVSGGKLEYGGHLDPNGYTTFLVNELHRYSRRDRPLRICLALQEHRKLSLDELSKRTNDLGLFGEIICLDADGTTVEWDANRGAAPEPIQDETVRARSLTALRQFMANDSDGRILIGGRREGFQGGMPGLVEEALYSLGQGKPLYLVGGFGGVTVDIIRALGVDDGAWLPASANEAGVDPRLTDALGQVATIASSDGWNLNNGLTDDENRKLAATWRPSEIAALVSLGLGRLSTE